MTPEYERITWEEVSKPASKMFHVWCGDGEIKWVEECWQHLGAAGLTGNTTPVEATASMLRLVTLARVYEGFCAHAWDENPETPLDYLTEDLEIDPLVLGILAATASSNVFDDCAEDDELREAALLAATDAQRQEIFTCLSQAYGGAVQLYSRMSKTNRTTSQEGESDEFAVTGPNSSALGYVMNGFQ
jgi:hypothetical protein